MPRFNHKCLVPTLTLVLLASSVLAVAETSKLSPELQGYTSSTPIPVIVQYSQPQSCGLLGCLLNFVGTVIEQLPLLNAVVTLVDGNQLQQLANDSTVVYVSLDRPVIMLLSNAAPAINAPAAWKSGYTGSGIGVAVVDSGINGSPDLNGGLLNLMSRVVYSQNFVAGSSTTADQYGHGTHVAGLIAGNGKSSTGTMYFRTFKGIAPSANLVNLRVLDANGAGTDSAVIAAISQAINSKSTYNIRVMNLSLGRPVMESYRLDPLCRAVEKAWQAGIVVVVSAGNYGRYNGVNNEGYGTITSPGNDPYVITVGAMKPMGTPQRTDDLIASYSSKGPTSFDHFVKPDIVAPGNLLVSLGYSVSSVALVPISRAFTWSGVSFGCACNRSATAPLTTPAAMLVPLRRPRTKNFLSPAAIPIPARASPTRISTTSSRSVLATLMWRQRLPIPM